MFLFDLILMVILFFCSAFFSSAESALFSLDPLQIHRIRKKHPRAADRIEAILSFPTHLLSAILVGNTLVNVAASSIGYAILVYLVPSEGLVIAIPTMTILILIFGEISPKRLALHIPETLSTLYALPLTLFITIMKPVVHSVNLSAKLLEKWLVPSPKITEDEFITALDESEKYGFLDKEERTIVDGIIRLEELSAGDIMTPRVDVIFADMNDEIDNIINIARKSKFKFLPVYSQTTDQVQGFLNVRHFLLGGGVDLTNNILPPIFIPLSTPLDKLMVLFQSQQKRIACVIDEFGGTAGIVTKGDVMEEIVWEESSNQDKSKSKIQKIGNSRWLIGGDTSLEEINSKLDTNLEAEGVTRISGWASAYLERIPRRGDVIVEQNCRVTIRNVRERRILGVIFEKIEPVGRSM